LTLKHADRAFKPPLQPLDAPQLGMEIQMGMTEPGGWKK
jgi:hypothetical protein